MFSLQNLLNLVLPSAKENQIAVAVAIEEAHEVKTMLAQAGGLPLETIDLIIDAAEYWPCTRTTVDTPYTVEASSADSTPPVPGPFSLDQGGIAILGGVGSVRWAHPVRKIIFRFVSRDQGWSGQPHDYLTYHGAHSWFEARVESPVPAASVAHARRLPAPQASYMESESGWRLWAET
ncbi:hypothetical protein BV25DRAFT_1912617 [Artomyces pyxidatus]|uniref:Uncharacterized protein n=1 Tax=Artomyces pyxidatus TaxID=48021 RepID=A0ACB8TDP7_9AGAM|nr:hypothetical protein BV25DRAFT_1912617 [Artomyces pyxidatus]